MQFGGSVFVCKQTRDDDDDDDDDMDTRMSPESILSLKSNMMPKWMDVTEH